MKIMTKACWLFLSAIMVAIPLLPLPAMAQEKQLALTLSLLPYQAEAKAGEENTFFLEVGNIGSSTVTGIKLSAERAEEGWVIVFSPAEIASIAPGSSSTIDISITPPHGAAKGGHSITVIAEADGMRTVTSIWLEVKAASLWLWIGIGIVVLVVAGFIIVYMRFGRQK